MSDTMGFDWSTDQGIDPKMLHLNPMTTSVDKPSAQYHSPQEESLDRAPPNGQCLLSVGGSLPLNVSPALHAVPDLEMHMDSGISMGLNKLPIAQDAFLFNGMISMHNVRPSFPEKGGNGNIFHSLPSNNFDPAARLMPSTDQIAPVNDHQVFGGIQPVMAQRLLPNASNLHQRDSKGGFNVSPMNDFTPHPKILGNLQGPSLQRKSKAPVSKAKVPCLRVRATRPSHKRSPSLKAFSISKKIRIAVGDTNCTGFSIRPPTTNTLEDLDLEDAIESLKKKFQRLPFCSLSQLKADDLLNQLGQIAIDEKKYRSLQSDTTSSTQDSQSNSGLADLEYVSDDTSVLSSTPRPVATIYDFASEEADHHESRQCKAHICDDDCRSKPLFHSTYPGCLFATHLAADWKRHEETTKHWPQQAFVCVYCLMPPVATDHNPKCQFCHTFITTNVEAPTTHYLHCPPARIRGKTFRRKDKLLAHIRNVHPHIANPSQAAAAGKLQNSNSNWPRNCGFCELSEHVFISWNERMEHIAQHFQEEAKIADWKLPLPASKGCRPSRSSSYRLDNDDSDDENSPTGGKGNFQRKWGGKKFAAAASSSSQRDQRSSGVHSNVPSSFGERRRGTASEKLLDLAGQQMCGSLKARRKISPALVRYLNDSEEPIPTLQSQLAQLDQLPSADISENSQTLITVGGITKQYMAEFQDTIAKRARVFKWAEFVVQTTRYHNDDLGWESALASTSNTRWNTSSTKFHQLRRNSKTTINSIKQLFDKSSGPVPAINVVPGNDNNEKITDFLGDLHTLGFEDVETILRLSDMQTRKVQDNNKFFFEGLVALLSKQDLNPKILTQLTARFINNLFTALPHPSLTSLGSKHKCREADGFYNTIQVPQLGAANTPYARFARPQYIALLDPRVIYDRLMPRGNNFEPHPNKISSMLFYLATLITHDIFRTDHEDFNNSMTSSYLDLAPLYGSDQNEQNSVRIFKDSKLKSDYLSEKIIFGFPPGVGVLVIMFNRFHNYIVTQLVLINKNSRFTKKKENANQKLFVKYNNDLFKTGRLITCGLYVDCISKDYVRIVLSSNRTGTKRDLHTRTSEARTLSNTFTAQSIGNQVSAKVKLIYRSHSAISENDNKWTQDVYKSIFPGKMPEHVTLQELLRVFRAIERNLPDDPLERPFAGLQRKTDGSLDDDALIEILRPSIDIMASSFGANRVPKILKSIEILGIIPAQSWNLASLNEFRQFASLPEHQTLENINPNHVVAAKLKNLYYHPNYVELYPGAVAEKVKPAMTTGSGLCVNFTPQIIVCGDQSSGQSSVLEAISGVPFPTGASTPRGSCVDLRASAFIQSLQDEELIQQEVAHQQNKEYLSSQFDAQPLIQKALDENRAKLNGTVCRLRERLDAMASTESPDREREVSHLKQEIDFSKQCLEICKAASDQAANQKIDIIEDVTADDDSDQVVVTVLADLFNIGKVKAKNRSMQLVGSIPVDALRDMSRDRYSSHFGAIGSNLAAARLHALQISLFHHDISEAELSAKEVDPGTGSNNLLRTR